ncbi:MAG TPA: SDR family oxidoreductase [Polyangiaceae bacterium]|jgi:3-oxoacyl-[acyl-carrier protein] reductase|nr:SDR family oxidoreductase [Polyangiaceae bacterium]
MLTIDLSGKLALLTGASGQLGRVMARTLAECGADLVLHYHQDQAGIERVAEDVRGLGRRAVSVQADVGTRAGVQRIADAAHKLGEPDILVINAVQQIHPWSTVLEESIEDYESQFRTCVLQAVYLVQAFVPALQRKGWGRVIGINTECTMQMFETQSAYVAGKRGMDGVLRVLAREIGRHGITVNQVAPGWTISDRDRRSSERGGAADDAGYCQQVPLRRRGTDREIANVVAFLASELSSYVHGAFVPVCGGNVMPTV